MDDVVDLGLGCSVPIPTLGASPGLLEVDVREEGVRAAKVPKFDDDGVEEEGCCGVEDDDHEKCG